MSLIIAPGHHSFHFDFSSIEQIILKLADEFNIRFEWDKTTALITTVSALIGGVIGGYTWSKVGAVITAGLSGATAYAVCTIVSLREVWEDVKDKLRELFYIVLNYLQTLNPRDIKVGLNMLMLCYSSRRELVCKIVDLMAEKLGREILSNLTAA